jgi:predicted NBD/HSP70 family sugar kinase
MTSSAASGPRKILILDVGGSHVKAYFSDDPAEVRITSGPTMTPREMVRQLKERLRGRTFDAVSIGYPGLVARGSIVREPHNLGPGWVGFDFDKALGRPTRIANDAALQALGTYRRGHMLFLGFGTGLGAAMIVEGKLQPMELAHLPYKKGKTFEDFVGEAALLRLGKKKWRREVQNVVELLVAALEPDDLVLSGGNLRKLDELPCQGRPAVDRAATRGGVRLWGEIVETPERPAARRTRPSRRAKLP